MTSSRWTNMDPLKHGNIRTVESKAIALVTIQLRLY